MITEKMGGSRRTAELLLTALLISGVACQGLVGGTAEQVLAPGGLSEEQRSPASSDGAGAPAPSWPAQPGVPGSSTAKVILVSIDGLRPDAISLAPAGNLRDLADRGAYSWRARTIDLSFTLPSHAAMVSGFLPSEHKLLHNDFRRGYIAVPTIMSTAKRAGKRVVLVVGKDKLIQLVPPESFDVFVWTPDVDEDIIDRAVQEVGDGFDFMFVHLPQVDLVGHVQGWMSEAYLEQVRTTDAALGRLVAALPPEATLIVTSDHGGSGQTHWSGQAEDLQIPWIAVGPGIRPGRELLADISTVDTAATAAYVLGLALDSSVRGRPVHEPWQQVTASPPSAP